MSIYPPYDLTANAIGFTEVIGAGGDWTHDGSNIWSRSLTTECTVVRFDSTIWGVEDASPDSKYEWDWADDKLLVYSEGNPTSYYSSIETASGYANQIDLAWTNGSTYDSVRVLRDDGSGFKPYDTITGSLSAYEDTDVTPNTLYNYKVRGIYGSEFSDFSNTDAAACWTDTLTEEVVIDESVTDYGTATDVSDTITETVEIADYVIDAKDVITNYVYYLGTAAGGVYEYGGFYKSDAGTAITARWESKDTDFADQNIEISDRFKTVEFVRLHYIDKSAGARISIKVSTDGGASWTTKTKSIGTGNSKGKIKDFYFVKTGQIFRLAIESISTVDEFQWVGLEVFYNSGGDYFEV